MSPTSKVALLMVGTALVATGVGFGAALFVKSPSQIASEASPPPLTTLTAHVETGRLSASLQIPATVSEGKISEVTPAGDGGIVTALPVSVGATVVQGTAIAVVNDRPVILLTGNVPLLRNLAPGDRGADVTRLQEALQYWGANVDGVWGDSTTAALKSVYALAGFEAPPGMQALATELVFAPAPAATIASIGSGLGQPVSHPLIRLAISPPIVEAMVSDPVAQRLMVGLAVSVTGVAIGGTINGTITSVGARVIAADGVARTSVLVSTDTDLPASAIEGKVEVSVPDDPNVPEGLLVPLSAVRARADGGTEVIVDRSGELVHVVVDVKATASGRALVEPLAEPLTAGESVVVGAP